jgi:uncharacterized metal-binding protein YceD (DUF177 family)
VSSSRFVVSVADLENGPKEVSLSLSEAWLRDVLEPAGASPRGAGSVTLELTKQGHEVMVRGHAKFGVTLPCVVTLDPVDFDLRPEIFLMLKPGPAERRGGEPSGAKKRPGAADPKPIKRKKRSNAPSASAAETAPEEDEATRDTYQGDEIVLDDYVREFLLLELPLYPRRPDLPSPEESLVSRPLAGPTSEKSIDPRLAPLAKLAERLRGAANKE